MVGKCDLLDVARAFYRGHHFPIAISTYGYENTDTELFRIQNNKASTIT